MRSFLFILGLLFCVMYVSHLECAAQEQATNPSATAPTQDEVVANNEPEAETFNARFANQEWMKTIDGFFANWLVAPMAKVLMFDISFGALNSEDEAGIVTSQVTVPFVVVWLFVAAIYLTIRMGFINLRGFYHAIQLTRGKYDDPSEPGEVTHFQALSSALSATVGLGNIGGVALAVGLGGPGATFWMIMMGFLGMTSKFAECSLGMLFRTTDESGRVLGGPMRTLKVGFSNLKMPVVGTVLSTIFAVLCIGASFGGGNAYQVGQSLGVLQEVESLQILRDHPYLYGIAMAFAVGLVIVGGIKTIGAVAGKIVPLMCIAYALVTIYIIVTHLDALPLALSRIITEAFQPKSIFVGSFIGVMVYGIQRAAFSNEAGVGSAAIAHSAAKTDEPVSEGIVALLEPFIDTVIVCSLTAFAIVVTGVFETEAGIALIKERNGGALTRLAFITGGPHWFAYVLYGCVIMFAYSTCISWSYYGERCFVALFGDASSIIYKCLFLCFTVLGSIVSRGNILDFSDLMILAMSVPNLIGVYVLSGFLKRELDDYWRKYKAGELEPAVKYESGASTK